VRETYWNSPFSENTGISTERGLSFLGEALRMSKVTILKIKADEEHRPVFYLSIPKKMDHVGEEYELKTNEEFVKHLKNRVFPVFGITNARILYQERD